MNRVQTIDEKLHDTRMWIATAITEGKQSGTEGSVAHNLRVASLREQERLLNDERVFVATGKHPEDV